MTSLLGAKKRAEEFAAAVDGTPADARPEFADLVGVVGALRAAAPPAPRAEFSVALRERLMAEAATSLTAQQSLALPPRKKGTRERRLVLAASAFVLVGGSAGMAAAAQNALPGDTLYPIKEILERAQGQVQTNQADHGRVLLGQADSRLAEAEALLAQSPDSAEVPATIDAFAAQAQEGAEYLLEAYNEDRDPALMQELRDFAAEGSATLQELAKVAGPDALSSLAEAAALLQQIDGKAASLCPTCDGGLPAIQLPAMIRSLGDVQAALEAARGANLDNGTRTPLGVDQAPRNEDGTAGTGGTKEPGTPAPSGQPGGLLDDVVGGITTGGQSGGDGPLAPVEDLTEGLLDTVGGLLNPEKDTSGKTGKNSSGQDGSTKDSGSGDDEGLIGGLLGGLG